VNRGTEVLDDSKIEINIVPNPQRIDDTVLIDALSSEPLAATPSGICVNFDLQPEFGSDQTSEKSFQSLVGVAPFNLFPCCDCHLNSSAV